MISRNLHQLTDMAVLGNYGTDALAAASMSTVWLNVVDIPLLSAVDQLSTLCGEAWGAGNLTLVGTWLHIMLVAIVVGSIPLIVARWFTADILVFYGFDPGVAAEAGRYAQWLQITCVFDLSYNAFRQYFASQGIAMPATVNDAAFVIINFALNYTLVFTAGLGLVGSAIGTSLSRFMLCGCFCIYCFLIARLHRPTWHWRRGEVFNKSRCCTLAGLVAPAAVGSFAEELQFQFIAILAGRMGKVIIAAHNLVVIMIMLFFTVANGLAMAIGIRVAHYLGAGEPWKAKRVAEIGVLLAAGTGLGLGCLMLLCGRWLDRLMSSDPAVREQLENLRLLTVGIIFFFLTFTTVYTLLMKQGRTTLPTTIIPVCCWLIGCPLSYYLGESRGMGLLGLWLGVITGYGLALVLLAIMLWRSDWPAICARSQQRAEADGADGEARELALRAQSPPAV